MTNRNTIAAAVVVCHILSACSGATTGSGEATEARHSLIAVGDVASCASTGDEATAALVDTIPGTIILAGDIAYESGTSREFAECYDPSWGRHKSRTRPAPGNHEYATANAASYFEYFGSAAGPANRGYYSFDVGAWHIISLNSNLSGTAASAQVDWVRADLASNAARCTLAYWHHSLFSSGLHGSDPVMRNVWQELYNAGADLVISGHDHDYERFSPQTAGGVADLPRGIREFVVGTGGRSLYPILINRPNSEFRSSDGYGVLRLSLGAADYTWRFVPVSPGSVTDSGSGTCH